MTTLEKVHQAVLNTFTRMGRGGDSHTLLKILLQELDEQIVEEREAHDDTEIIVGHALFKDDEQVGPILSTHAEVLKDSTVIVKPPFSIREVWSPREPKS